MAIYRADVAASKIGKYVSCCLHLLAMKVSD